MTNIYKRYIVIAFLLVVCISLLIGLFTTTAYAATLDDFEYSSPVDDLKIDPDFDESIYPSNEKDYSLQVVQIAESTDGSISQVTERKIIRQRQSTFPRRSMTVCIIKTICWNCLVVTECSVNT